MVAEDSY
jgi:myosin heavy subunit